MTIRTGEPWGEPVDRPADLVVADSDARLAELVERGPAGNYAVSGGDVHRMLGSPGPGGDRLQRLPIDVLRVETDRSEHLAVAHLVIRRRWWRGRIIVVCNVDHLGTWNIAPRAHPNDGLFDLVDVDPAMPLRARFQARHRLPLGTHVPHPQITVRRHREWEWADPAGAEVWVDGVSIGTRTRVEVRIVPDATAVHV